VEGDAAPPADFPLKPVAWTIPAHTTVSVLLDQDRLTTAFPEVQTSGGRGTSIELEYSEALWIPGGGLKGNRDEIEGKEVEGNRDRYVLDGGSARIHRPLFWRCYRYVLMTVTTADEPVTIEDVRGVYTGYPFERRARFNGGGDELARILEVGWRSA